MPKTYVENYAKNKKHPKIRRFFNIILIVIVCVMVIMVGRLFSDILVGDLLFNAGSVKIECSTFYAICFGEFDSLDDAKKCAVWLENAGGAGYIFKSDKYLVFARTYDNESDAKKVIENIGTTIYDGSVKTFKTKSKKIKLKNCKKADKKNLLSCVNQLNNIVKSVADIDVSIDTNGLTNIGASNNLNSLKTNVGDIRLKLVELNKCYANIQINGLIAYCNMVLNEIDLAVNKLLVSTNETSVCKYLLTNLKFGYYSFVNNI